LVAQIVDNTGVVWTIGARAAILRNRSGAAGGVVRIGLVTTGIISTV